LDLPQAHPQIRVQRRRRGIFVEIGIEKIPSPSGAASSENEGTEYAAPTELLENESRELQRFRA
jgi:hypothetical protein